MRRSELCFISRSQLSQLISLASAVEVVRDAFIQMGRGYAVLPEVMYLNFPESGGEVHAKGAHITGSRYFTIKVASGFPGNSSLGLPANGGLVLVFSAVSGLLHAVLFDDGLLTELRTAAAGAVAADLLARRPVRQLGLIGSGVQARMQLEATLGVRMPERVRVWNRTRERAVRLVEEVSSRFAVDIEAVCSVSELVSTSDLLITATAATDPIVLDDWVSAGVHINAVGADTPTKNEIDPQVFRRARVVVDSLHQCTTQGELRSALGRGTIESTASIAELGELAAGIRLGRESDDEITICDMTGLGVLDAAVASFVVERANLMGIGDLIQRDESGLRWHLC